LKLLAAPAPEIVSFLSILNIRFITGVFGALAIATGATGAEVVRARVIGAKVVGAEPSEPVAIHYKAPAPEIVSFLSILNIRFITGACGALAIAAGATGAEVVGARVIGAYVIRAKVVGAESAL
jgi:hypothetical protein